MLSYEVKDLDTSSTREQSLLVRRAESCTAAAGPKTKSPHYANELHELGFFHPR